MTVDLEIACDAAQGVPPAADVNHWVDATLEAAGKSGSVAIRVVDGAEMQALNREFRGKDAPTNVLAFGFESIPGIDYPHLGDIAICLEVVKTEANQQHKPVRDHFALMVVHGTLHLCGYDHILDRDARIMESTERTILEAMGMERDQP